MSYSIILDRPKSIENVGSVLRVAHNFGCSSVYIIGTRYKRAKTDVFDSSMTIPLLNFKSWSEYKATSNKWVHIGIEIKEYSGNLINFVHPESAVYILGPEDGSIAAEGLAICKYVLHVPTYRCMNLGVCAAVLTYDRMAKSQKYTGLRQ